MSTACRDLRHCLREQHLFGGLHTAKEVLPGTPLKTVMHAELVLCQLLLWPRGLGSVRDACLRVLPVLRVAQLPEIVHTEGVGCAISCSCCCVCGPTGHLSDVLVC